MTSHECYGPSKHQPFECLFNCLFQLTLKKQQWSRLLALCEGNHQWFTSQMASNAESIFISWHHYGCTNTTPRDHSPYDIHSKLILGGNYTTFCTGITTKHWHIIIIHIVTAMLLRHSWRLVMIDRNQIIVSNYSKILCPNIQWLMGVSVCGGGDGVVVVVVVVGVDGGGGGGDRYISMA